MLEEQKNRRTYGIAYVSRAAKPHQKLLRQLKLDLHTSSID